MSEKKIVVPEGMLDAGRAEIVRVVNSDSRLDALQLFHFGLEAALGWLSENPTVPTEEQAKKLIRDVFGYATSDWESFPGKRYLEEAKHALSEWLRRMFLAPEPKFKFLCPTCNQELRDGATTHATGSVRMEPEVPEEIKDLLSESRAHLTTDSDSYNAVILEAYRRGQRNPK